MQKLLISLLDVYKRQEKDLIYHIYGRDITAAVLKVEHETELFKLRGFIGKPIISRGNRNYENYFINGRYIKSALIATVSYTHLF